MKVHQEKEFKPVVITLETEEELHYLRSFIEDNYYVPEKEIEKRRFLINLFHALGKCND